MFRGIVRIMLPLVCIRIYARNTSKWGLFSFSYHYTESKPSLVGIRRDKSSTFLFMLPDIRLLTALFGLKVRQFISIMISLEECKRLMQKFCDLPDNIEELKKQGFQEKKIEAYKDLVRLFGPEVSAKIKRMKELIDYKSQL